RPVRHHREEPEATLGSDQSLGRVLRAAIRTRRRGWKMESRARRTARGEEPGTIRAHGEEARGDRAWLRHAHPPFQARMCGQTQRKFLARVADGVLGRGMRTLTLARGLATVVFIALAHPASATVPDDLCPAAQDPCIVNTALTLTPGSVIDLGGRALQFG